jgi:hypothetical protein
MIKRNSLFSSKTRKANRKRIFIGGLLIFFLILNFILLSSNLLFESNSPSTFPNLKRDNSPRKPQSQGIYISLLQDPYTVNFNDTWNFFETNYTSDLDIYIDTYFRLGDEDGTILNDSVYSLDNLLLYNTLLKHINEYSASEILSIYLDLKDTDLWYDNGGYEYGFVDSLDNSTQTVNNYRRNLIDNLMPIFLLIENIPDSPEGPYLTNIYETFDLISSNQFWNDSNDNFLNYNSSNGNVYAIDNLYAVLATLLVNQTDDIDSQYKIDAGNLANKTMETLSAKFWDKNNKGYFHSLLNDLSSTVDNNKYLETNALGIITLIEYWKVSNNSEYLNNATMIFNKINTTLFNGTYGAYQNQTTLNWANPDDFIDVKSNAMMMQACLKLFEVSGNISYYNSALSIYNTLENTFYDSTNKAYSTSLDISTTSENKDKNLLYNLRVCEAYLAALEIYENTTISSSFNSNSSIPEFIFDQEDLIITTNYTYSSQYANYSIPNADLTYTIRYPYPNDDILATKHNSTNENGTHVFSYYLPTNLTIADNYSITILANKSFFKFAYTTLYFNVSSGIEYISGLENENEYNQGVNVNITLLVNNTRNNNVTLNFSIIADSNLIISPRSYLLNASQESSIWNNFTVKNNAIPGNYTFHFILKNGSDIYLDYTKLIEIKTSLEVTNLIYDSRVVEGDITKISLNIANFLQNQTSSFNLSIMGENIAPFEEEYNLNPNEIKSIDVSLNLDDIINTEEIQINILISRNNTIYYNNTITIQIINSFELSALFYPSSVTQGSSAQFICTINNNKETNEIYALYVNGEISYGVLVPAQNRIEVDLEPIKNPYDISTKTYEIAMFDSSGRGIFQFFFKTQIQVSTMNLVIFYILPILIPIIIVLFFINKKIKTDRLKR